MNSLLRDKEVLKKVKKDLEVSKESEFCFLQEDFIEFFGKTQEELYQEFTEIMGDKEINCKKKEYFHKYVPEINYKNLIEYYKSHFFILSLLRDSGLLSHPGIKKINQISRYFFSFEKLLICSESGLQMLLPRIFFPKRGRPKKILEYGCGPHLRLINFIPEDFEVTFADIPHSFFQFVRKSINRHLYSVKFVDLVSDSSLQEKYDYIICQEVLEHVLEPEEVLRHLIEHLNEGGLMWLSVFMDDMKGEDPSHLSQNTIRYNNPDTWHAIVEKNGLKPLIYTVESSVIKGWYKPPMPRRYF